MAHATQGSVVRHHSRLPASQRACAKRLRAQAFFQFRNQAGGAPAQKGRGNKEAGQGEETGDVPPEERGKDNVKQKLDPLTSTDESKRTVGSGLLPFDEQETDEVMKDVTYASPKAYRRRPGNVFVLAWKNLKEELWRKVTVGPQGGAPEGPSVRLPAADEPKPDHVVDAEEQGQDVGTGTIEGVKRQRDAQLPEAFGFTLSNQAIHEFDREHPSPGREPTPKPIQWAYSILLAFVDKVYEGRAIERFWFLETVARMPYFSYTTCLHLYETIGWWRTGGLRLVHFAEEWNELHHLLIMEALGGDKRWIDRFLGQHASILYYWALVVVFFFSPKWSYKFSEMLETHAVSTYRQFIIENGALLKTLPAPRIARSYYISQDPYLFNMDSAFARGPTNDAPRIPACSNLYDVFVNILEDEWEHVKTMVMCQDYDLLESLKVTQTEFHNPQKKEEDTRAQRELWNQWAADLQKMDDMIEMRKM